MDIRAALTSRNHLTERMLKSQGITGNPHPVEQILVLKPTKQASELLAKSLFHSGLQDQQKKKA